LFCDRFSSACVFPLAGGDHAGDGVGEARGVVARTEVGFEFFNDAKAFGIGETGLETIADFNALFAILNENEENGAVVFVFESDAPGLVKTVGIVLDAGVGLHLGVDGHEELVRRVALKLGELFVERARDGFGDDFGKVVEEAFGDWGEDLRGERADGEAGDEQAGKEAGHAEKSAGRLRLGGLGAAEVEVNLRGLLGTGLGLKVRAFFKTKQGGIEYRGDAFDFGVVGLDDFVKSTAFDGNAVFRAFELGLEGLEIGVGFQVGVALDDDHEATECATKGTLGFVELLELGWIGGRVVELDFADGGAGFGDFRQGGFFEVGSTFDGLNQVGDEVGSALVDVLNLSPLGADGFLRGNEAIIAAHDS